MTIHFLGLGVQKAGTTTLHDILKQHSEIYLPVKKEAHFFDFDDRYKMGLEALYKSFFPSYNNEKFVGDFTPEYLYFEEAPQRILETLGNKIKFIIVFRDPVNRAISHYNMTYRRGLEKQNFWEAIKYEYEKIGQSQWHKMHFSYISRGYYAQQLKRYLKIFPPENFLYLTFEENIINNIEETIITVQNFLGTRIEKLDCEIKSNEAFIPRSVKLNQFIRKNKKIKPLTDLLLPSQIARKFIVSSIYKLNKKSNKDEEQFKLDQEHKKVLYQKYYVEDIRQLEKMIGKNFKKIWKYE